MVGQTFEHVIRDFLVSQTLPEASTPLSPTGSWPLLFSFVILFSPYQESCSRLGSYPESLAHVPSSWAFAAPPGYSRWACLSLSPSGATSLQPGPCRAAASQAGLPASQQSLLQKRTGNPCCLSFSASLCPRDKMPREVHRYSEKKRHHA